MNELICNNLLEKNNSFLFISILENNFIKISV